MNFHFIEFHSIEFVHSYIVYIYKCILVYSYRLYYKHMNTILYKFTLVLNYCTYITRIQFYITYYTNIYVLRMRPTNRTISILKEFLKQNMKSIFYSCIIYYTIKFGIYNTSVV